jgi:hypothetical protein
VPLAAYRFLVRLRIHKEQLFVGLASDSPARKLVHELFLVGLIDLKCQARNQVRFNTTCTRKDDMAWTP